LGVAEAGGTELMLNTAYEHDERPPTPDGSRVTAHGDTAFFFGCRDLDAAYTYLRAKGISVQPPLIAHYGMKQLYLRDPDGYGICLQCAQHDRFCECGAEGERKGVEVPAAVRSNHDLGR
jgi:catechol 2,3-dioxygenase-like lactoylglutathione lyase family enzyme